MLFCVNVFIINNENSLIIINLYDNIGMTKDYKPITSNRLFKDVIRSGHKRFKNRMIISIFIKYNYKNLFFLFLRKRGIILKDVSYDLIKKGLDMSSMRQKTISNNISNINTPGFKAGRIEFEEILQKAKDVSMSKTDNMHFGVRDIDDINLQVKKRNTTMLNDNGNNVDIDLEMTELSANEIYYNTLIRQVNAKLGNMSYVING